MNEVDPGAHASAGVTLPEMLFALLILWTLMQLSTPLFDDLITGTRGDAAMRSLRKAISFTRAAAVTSGQMTTMCRSRDARRCGGRWEDGVLVFHDGDGDLELDAGQQALAYIDLDADAGRIHWRAFRNRQYLQFTPLGFTRYQNGNFTFCPRNGRKEHARQLILSRTGKVREAKDNDGDGIPEDSRGRPLRC